jgi:hypothetical protein
MKCKTLLVALIFTFLTCPLKADAPPFNVTLGVSYNSPPIRAYISDSSGLRTGIDPNIGLNQYGEQLVNGINSQLHEIPNSSALQSNLEGVNSTYCEFSIDNPSGAYTLNYSTDLPESSGEVLIEVENFSPGMLLKNKVSLLCKKGTYKKMTISVDSAGGLTITPVINIGDFLKDTQAACGLGSISPPEACEALEDLASAVEKSKTQGNLKREAEEIEAYLSILNRLHNWGEKGYRQDWDDFKDHSECDHLRQRDLHETKFFAKDPAYSALKLDAETLLKGLPKEGGRDKDGHRDGDDRGDASLKASFDITRV